MAMASSAPATTAARMPSTPSAVAAAGPGAERPQDLGVVGGGAELPGDGLGADDQRGERGDEPERPERDRLRADRALRLAPRSPRCRRPAAAAAAGWHRRRRRRRWPGSGNPRRRPRRTGRRPPAAGRCRRWRCSRARTPGPGPACRSGSRSLAESMSSCTTWVLTTPMPVTVRSRLPVERRQAPRGARRPDADGQSRAHVQVQGGRGPAGRHHLVRAHGPVPRP